MTQVISRLGVQKRIEKLEQRLRIFEYILEDTNRYLARIILDGVIVISLLLLYVDCAVWLSLSIIIELKQTNHVLTYINILVWLLNILGLWVFSFLCLESS